MLLWLLISNHFYTSSSLSFPCGTSVLACTFQFPCTVHYCYISKQQRSIMTSHFLKPTIYITRNSTWMSCKHFLSQHFSFQPTALHRCRAPLHCLLTEERSVDSLFSSRFCFLLFFFFSFFTLFECFSFFFFFFRVFLIILNKYKHNLISSNFNSKAFWVEWKNPCYKKLYIFHEKIQKSWLSIKKFSKKLA